MILTKGGEAQPVEMEENEQKADRNGGGSPCRQRATHYTSSSVFEGREVLMRTTGKIYDKQFSLYLTSAMFEQVQQATRKRRPLITENEWIREAIRAHLENEGDAIGSRRHFQRTLHTRLGEMEREVASNVSSGTQMLLFYLHLIVYMLAFALAQLLSAQIGRKIEPQQLIQKGVSDTLHEGSALFAQIEAVRNNK